MSSVEVSAVGEPTKSLLLFAAGFEERALAHARLAEKSGVRYDSAILVTYSPRDPKNRVEDAWRLAKAISASSCQIDFDRYAPHACEALGQEALASQVAGRPVVLDISGMSRFLICLLVVRLLRAGIRLTIAYAEAAEYHPTPDEFATAHLTRADASDLMFLTTGLYGLAAVDDLTTSSMQGYPEVLIASPSFEPRFLRALFSELSPGRVVLLEGVPRTAHAWRREAVKKLNAFAFELAERTVSVDTDDIDGGTRATMRLFDEHKYTHRFVLAPAPSKLIAVGQAVAIAEGVQAEVVYPTPEGFSDPYSEGMGSLRYWEILRGEAG